MRIHKVWEPYLVSSCNPWVFCFVLTTKESKQVKRTERTLKELFTHHMGQRMHRRHLHITNPWKTPEQTASSSHGHDEVISRDKYIFPRFFKLHT